MRAVNRSDIGRVRQVNEDRAWSIVLPNGAVIAIVADGMGGHQAGDVASQLAVDTFRDAVLQEEGELTIEITEAKLRDAILQANQVVFELASRNERYHNMGTTVVAAALVNGEGIAMHIGDSRAYLLREGKLRQLTEDHTLVNELAKSGQISPEEAANHPRRNVLTRALGTEAAVDVDMTRFEWKTGDQLLLCSDGLYSMVEEELLLRILSEEKLDLEGQADRLIELALEGGGDDNVTLVLVSGQSQAGGEVRES